MTREEAIDFAEFLKNNWIINFAEMEEFCDMAIEALQAERHGEWQITKVEGGKIYVCSECSEAIYKSTFEENVHYYCNNCGAKMDKE